MKLVRFLSATELKLLKHVRSLCGANRGCNRTFKPRFVNDPPGAPVPLHGVLSPSVQISEGTFIAEHSHANSMPNKIIAPRKTRRISFGQRGENKLPVFWLRGVLCLQSLRKHVRTAAARRPPGTSTKASPQIARKFHFGVGKNAARSFRGFTTKQAGCSGWGMGDGEENTGGRSELLSLSVSQVTFWLPDAPDSKDYGPQSGPCLPRAVDLYERVGKIVCPILQDVSLFPNRVFDSFAQFLSNYEKYICGFRKLVRPRN